jgi:ankyrin repeat protein
LLETRQVDVNLMDSDGCTPLSGASSSGHKAVVKVLLETRKVDVGFRDFSGRTPLLLAALKGHTGVVKLSLATRQVDVNELPRPGFERSEIRPT